MTDHRSEDDRCHHDTPDGPCPNEIVGWVELEYPTGPAAYTYVTSAEPTCAHHLRAAVEDLLRRHGAPFNPRIARTSNDVATTVQRPDDRCPPRQ